MKRSTLALASPFGMIESNPEGWRFDMRTTLLFS
jgi:hypothetical protein